VRRLPFYRVEQLPGSKGRAVHGPLTLHPDYSKRNTIITVNPYFPKMAWLSHFLATTGGRGVSCPTADGT
jgi:hypothetical protein